MGRAIEGRHTMKLTRRTLLQSLAALLPLSALGLGRAPNQRWPSASRLPEPPGGGGKLYLLPTEAEVQAFSRERLSPALLSEKLKRLSKPDWQKMQNVTARDMKRAMQSTMDQMVADGWKGNR